MNLLLAKRKFLLSGALLSAEQLIHLGGVHNIASARTITPTPIQSTDRIRIGGTGSGLGGMALIANAFLKQNPTLHIEIMPALGSSGGIRALVDQRLDLALSNRMPNEQEISNQLVSTLYARTPFVVAVHRDLGISQISSTQLVRLYSESAATFPNGKRARPVMRSSDAADTAILKLFSAEISDAIDIASKRRGLLEATTDSECADLIEKTPGGFGPLSLGLIVSEQRPLTALTVDKFKPSVAALQSGQYPFYKRLFMIQAPKSNPAVNKLIAFILSNEGRSILLNSGHATS
jgi:phosphate transport system substrate-binding protein